MVSSGIQEAQKDQRCVRNVKALIMISLKVKKTMSKSSVYSAVYQAIKKGKIIKPI